MTGPPTREPAPDVGMSPGLRGLGPRRQIPLSLPRGGPARKQQVGLPEPHPPERVSCPNRFLAIIPAIRLPRGAPMIWQPVPEPDTRAPADDHLPAAPRRSSLRISEIVGTPGIPSRMRPSAAVISVAGRASRPVVRVRVSLNSDTCFGLRSVRSP